MIRDFICTLLVLICCISCASKSKEEHQQYSSNRQRMEVEAQKRLTIARQQMVSSCQEAKATIEQMRKDCYLALDARAEGILLMDTIDLRLAQQDLAKIDSLMHLGVDTIGQEDFEEACRKVQFYERKIQFDKKKKE